MKQKLNWMILFTLIQAPFAHSVEFVGLISDDISHYTTRPSNYVGAGGGIGYGFLGRLDLGPGQIESGLLYTATSITTQQAFGDVKTIGSFWIVPLMYRIYALPPFVSIALGFDYAIVSNSSIEVAGNALGTNYSSGYKGHFGAEASIEALQDIGENLSVVLDLRYRHGLGDALSLNGVGVRYQAYIISLGLQKRLE